MRVIGIQTRLPTGQVETLSIEAERVLIGSAAHCDVRLPVDQAKAEHVLVELGPAGAFARALAFEPPPTINNVPFTQVPLQPNATLGVNQCQLLVTVGEATGGGDAITPKKRTSPLTVISMLIMIPAAIYIFFVDDPSDIPSKNVPRKLPELWAAPITECTFSGPQAAAFARERITVADAKRERRPFHVQDGVSAVAVYETAASCFRAGGDAASAALADESAKFLRREMNDDFRSRHVRLEHALDVQDYPQAQKEVRLLLQFTEGKSGEYVTWLTNLDRKLKAKIGEKKS